MINMLMELIEEVWKLDRTPTCWVMHPLVQRRLVRDVDQMHWSFSASTTDATHLFGIPMRADSSFHGVRLESK